MSAPARPGPTLRARAGVVTIGVTPRRKKGKNVAAVGGSFDGAKPPGRVRLRLALIAAGCSNGGMKALPDPFAPRDRKTREIPFDFVLEQLASLGPSTRAMFGSTAVYLDERVVFILRKKGDGDDGVWVAHEPAVEQELRAVLPRLARIDVVGGSWSWKKLAATSEHFEDDVLLACSLLRRGDTLIGKVPERQKAASTKARDAAAGPAKKAASTPAKEAASTKARGAAAKPAKKAAARPVKKATSTPAKKTASKQAARETSKSTSGARKGRGRSRATLPAKKGATETARR